jgi:hypothetical protein
MLRGREVDSADPPAKVAARQAQAPRVTTRSQGDVEIGLERTEARGGTAGIALAPPELVEE